MSAQNKTWYAVTNKTADSADVEIYDEIGGWGVSASEFIKGLKGLEGKHINLRINSPGGSIIDGQAIIAALSRHKAGFTAWVEGLAASMASVIACAADQCFMAEGSMMMVHRASTVSIGDAETLRKDASLLEKFEKGLLNIYAAKTGMDLPDIEKMLAEETWMDATEAVAFGFADGITENSAAMACVSKDQLRARFDKFAKGMAEPIEPKADEPVVETPVVEAPVVEPTVEAPVVEVEPEAPVEPTALAKNISALVIENKALKAERDSLKAERDSIAASLEMAQAAIGVLPARVEPILKPSPEAESNILQKWDAITDPAEKDQFYKKHRNEILSAFKR